MTLVTQLHQASDIATRADLAALVGSFYGRVLSDELLGPVFRDVAHFDLEAHSPIMCDFWESVLFRAGIYKRDAFGVHRSLNELHRLTEDDFARWLSLWAAAVDERFTGPVAEKAKAQAGRVATGMFKRLNSP